MKKIFFFFTLIVISSLVLSFFVTNTSAADKLPPPEKISPDHYAEDVPTLVNFLWRRVPGADKYQIKVWEDGQKEVAENILRDTQKTFNLWDGKTYWWNVKVSHEAGLFGWGNDCGEQDSGASWIFTTKEKPPPTTSGEARTITECYNLSRQYCLNEQTLVDVRCEWDVDLSYCSCDEYYKNCEYGCEVDHCRSAPTPTSTSEPLKGGDVCGMFRAEAFCKAQESPKTGVCLKESSGYICEGNNRINIFCETVEDRPFECICDISKSKGEVCQYGCENGMCLSEEGQSLPPAPGPPAPGAPGIAVKIEPPIKWKTFKELINAIIDFLFTISLAIVPLMIVIAGILFVTSAGNPEQVRRAKDLIIYTLIGFGIVLISKGLITLLRQVLAG